MSEKIVQLNEEVIEYFAPNKPAKRNRQIPQCVAKGGKVCHTIGVHGSTP